MDSTFEPVFETHEPEVPQITQTYEPIIQTSYEPVPQTTRKPIRKTYDPKIPESIQSSDCQGFWNSTFADIGSMGNYPRPQGNLPMFNWGLTEQKQNQLSSFYKQAFSNYK